MGFGYSFLIGIAAAIFCAVMLFAVGMALRRFQWKGVDPIFFIAIGVILAGGESVFLYTQWDLHWGGLITFGLIAVVPIVVLADIFSSTGGG